MKGRIFAGVIALGLLVAPAAHAAKEPWFAIPPRVVVPAFDPSADPRPVQFQRAVIKISEGQVWAKYAQGLSCGLFTTDVRWNSRLSELDKARFQSIFDGEVIAASLAKAEAPDLFQTEGPPGLHIGVVITDMKADVCTAGAPGYETQSAKLLMTAEWQVFDPIQRVVVARIDTLAGQDRGGYAPDGVEKAVLAAFRQNVRALLATPAYRAVVLAKADPVARPASHAPITLASKSTAGTRKISDATGSVVAVFADSGHGSGFLVSEDGHLLTNRHVVGGSKFVKVRWSDGFETVGEVVRSDPRRDVALIKTDPHGRTPLALRRGAVQPGEMTYAIGTPLDEKFQGTVTKGVISANRILDGFNYIQSDVTVNPGNSGGPLLDENGGVVGITVIGVREGDAPTGINLFIPIGDALDFLNLKTAAAD